jgi:hypothetical protein
MEQQAMMQQKTTLEQKMAIVANLALFPAMPVIVLIRKKPGYRFLSPIKLLIMFILLNALTAFGYTSGRSSSTALLQILAWGTLILGLVKRQFRWRDIKRGVSWHTWSRGISFLTFLPISDSNLKRFVEPILVIIIGAILAFPFTFFGLYLVIAGLCLFLFEAYDYEKSLNMMLDQLDSLVDSEVMSSNVEYYSEPNVSQRPLEQTAGIPTGIAPDIEVQIQRRRRPTVTLPDDLVMEPPIQGQPGAAI